MSRNRRRWVHTTSCQTGKRRYANEYDAERDMRRIAAQVRAEGKTRVPRQIYLCTYCQGWHLTSTVRVPRPPAQNRDRRLSAQKRRRQRKRLMRITLLAASPACEVRGADCEGRATDIVPVVPRHRGGDQNDPTNWLTACTPCTAATLDRQSSKDHP